MMALKCVLVCGCLSLAACSGMGSVPGNIPGPPAATSSTSTQAARLPDCSRSSLRVRSVKPYLNAGGARYSVMVVQNRTRRACAITSIAVRYYDRLGHQVGLSNPRPGRLINELTSRTVGQVRLGAGVRARVRVGTVTPAFFGAKGCASREAVRQVVEINQLRSATRISLPTCSSRKGRPGIVNVAT